MTGAPSAFQTLCRDVTHRFVRTAILIDDEIVTPPPADVAAAPLVEPAFLAKEGNVPEGADADEAVTEAAEAANAAVTAAEPAAASSDVALKPLADAFLDQKIVCAVLNPSADDEAEQVVQRAINAASSADVVIIDWYLRTADPELTIHSLTGLLRADAESNGRKRLIIVYTSATPLDDRCAELFKRLEEEGLPTEKLDGDLPTLRAGSSRIVFVEKAAGERGTTVEQLPALALSEFAKEADGLMPIFALGAIAQIRDSTHHLLSIFRAELDPALVGHRMVLHEPIDARDFALEVFLLQLRSILSGGVALDGVLDKDSIRAWFNERFPDAMDTKLTDADVVRAEFQTAVEDANPKEKFGGEKVKKFHSALFLPQQEGEGNTAERDRSSELARLSSYLREAEGITPLRPQWRPSLTIGTILRSDGKGGAHDYYLCTQPLCDTLRLSEPTFFSFVKLEASTSGDSKEYWVIVRSDGKHVQLKAAKSVPGRYFAEFIPDAESKKIMADADGADGRKFIFKDKTGKSYLWIADIDRMKAQRAAEELASSLGRVGVDEYEWLRMGGKIKV